MREIGTYPRDHEVPLEHAARLYVVENSANAREPWDDDEEYWLNGELTMIDRVVAAIGIVAAIALSLFIVSIAYLGISWMKDRM